jgi:hypothetical protein
MGMFQFAKLEKLYLAACDGRGTSALPWTLTGPVLEHTILACSMFKD